MEKVLLFRMRDEEAAVIADMLAAMKIKCERVPESAFHQTIGALASGRNGKSGIQTAPDKWNAEMPQSTEGSPGTGIRQDAPQESLMVFCDVSEKHFNRALALLRSRTVRVDYKAVLTPTNKEWNVLRLYAELAREKAEYERMKG